MLKNLIVLELGLFYGLSIYWLFQYRIKTAIKSIFILFYLIICGEHLPFVVFIFIISLLVFWILLYKTYDGIVKKILQEEKNINFFLEINFLNTNIFRFIFKPTIQINKLQELFEKNYSKKNELCFLTACRISFILFFVVTFYVICWEFIFVGIKAFCFFLNCSDMLDTLVALIGKQKTTKIFYIIFMFRPTMWWILKCISKRLYFNLLIVLIKLHK